MRQVMSFAQVLRRRSLLALPILGVTALAFLAPTPAKGALVLTWTETQGPAAGAHGSMSDPSNTIDVNSAPFGDFSTNVNVGVSNLNTGSSQAVLQINSIDSTFQPSSSGPFSGPVTLVITLTDNGFSFPGTGSSALRLSPALPLTLPHSLTPRPATALRSPASHPIAAPVTLSRRELRPPPRPAAAVRLPEAAPQISRPHSLVRRQPIRSKAS